MSPGIKGYDLGLKNMIFKHEFMHAWHWTVTPNNNTKFFYKYSERGASAYSMDYYKSIGNTGGANFYRNVVLENGGFMIPKSYFRANFNKIIPTW